MFLTIFYDDNYWYMEENSNTNPILFKPIEARIELNMFKYP